MANKKKPNLYLRLAVLYVASFLTSVLPLIICFVVNADKYIKTPSDAIRLCTGGAIAGILMLFATIGKLPVPRRITGLGVALIIAYLMQNILSDLILLLAMALLGELINCIFFSRAIRLTRENILIGKTADVTATQVEEVIKKYVGNGRV